MSICTDIFRPLVLRPRRIRSAECSAFADQNRWVNLVATFNLTPDPADNKPSQAPPAWTVWDLPVTYAMQDVSARGDDLLFVAVKDRVYVLDWDRYRDEWNWEAYGRIYRRLTFGPIPGSREEQEDGQYRLADLRRFRSFTYQLAEAPPDNPVQSQYKITVSEDGDEGANPAQGYRRTQRHGDAKVAKRGYSFLVTVEHDANEDFPLLWWQAEWEELGGRRREDTIVST